MIGANATGKLRVSVATYNQVNFPHPETGMTMLALERKATVLRDGKVDVRAQPFGGGVRILDLHSLTSKLGDIEFDSRRSKQEQDFRILIPPATWGLVKQYCLDHLGNPNDHEIESSPDRELIEEFEETLHVHLKPGQFMVRSMGFVIEDDPVLTDNWYAPGNPTVRVYRTYKVQIVDAALSGAMLDASRQMTDDGLARRALENGRGRVNSIVVLPLHLVRETYLALAPQARYRRVVVEGHELDESVPAVLDHVDVPQYQRLG